MNDQTKKVTAAEGQTQIKRMSLMQLTFIVAVNMMGSGIIMLPTNMAQVGAISLLSWIVTALGSMAIAYGFAQAGLFNTRPGGLAAYAEDAYGRSGYFLTFFLYFISIAVGNVAIAISAVGYLAHFFPWLSSTPASTCVGVIGLLWLTTVANFGGPSVTGRIGSLTVWGVILPVGLLSVVGWFWFKPDVFAAAWNPKGLGLFEGMGSSISLTLWAFLGMESAAQNSDAVEDPKRNVPLACMFGTLGAAVIYVLSTTAIQGIVPNADLAASTGPFGLAYEHMFSPVIGGVVMVLAAIACVGSLLGWQFTFAQTGKSAADERMFPGPSFVPPRVRCRIDVFRTPRQPYWRIADAELGWGTRTTGGVDVHDIDGEHDTFMREEHVGVLAQKLGGCLDNAEEEIELLARESARLAAAAAPGAGAVGEETSPEAP